MKTTMRRLLDLQHGLERGELRSRDLVELSLSAIADPAGQGSRAFLSVFPEQARKQADFYDQARRDRLPMPRWAGIPMAIKDLFDTLGQVTGAGSHVLDACPPAERDADVVAALRRAGFIVIGKNHMTEFAYSGLGLNAHFDVPLNPFGRDVGRIPGGSSSGGAVAVADGMVAAALGSDTGGSCRIPAAFCGIVGFKPTARRVSRSGVIPLSSTLDAVGPLANSVSCCAILDAILSGVDEEQVPAMPAAGLRLGVIQGYVDDQLDEAVAQAFEGALERLSRQGVHLVAVPLPELGELPHIHRMGGFVGAEAHAWHRPHIESRSQFYDPWVLSRFAAGKSQSAADYIDLLLARQRLIAAVQRRSHAFDALVLPTVQIAPPMLSSLSEATAISEANRLCLRNTSIANFLDLPAISIPCHAPESLPVGLMLLGETMADRQLLGIARSLEAAINPTCDQET